MSIRIRIRTHTRARAARIQRSSRAFDHLLHPSVVDAARLHRETLHRRGLVQRRHDWSLPSQEIHAVYPSPRQVPAKVSGFIAWLQGQIGETWWSDPP